MRNTSFTFRETSVPLSRSGRVSARAFGGDVPGKADAYRKRPRYFLAASSNLDELTESTRPHEGCAHARDSRAEHTPRVTVA